MRAAPKRGGPVYPKTMSIDDLQAKLAYGRPSGSDADPSTNESVISFDPTLRAFLIELLEVVEQSIGGGGGGSLPAWWTVDSTPGAESVEFAGVVAVAPADPDLDVLATITAPTGFLDGNSNDYGFLQMVSETGERVWTFDASGDMWARGAGTQGHSALFMRSVDSPTYSMDLQSGSAGAVFIRADAPGRAAFRLDQAGNIIVGGYAEIDAGDGVGLVSVGPTAAPADAAVFAPGVFTFWMDTTNGAAKLMVKARQANGTVVTGSVNLT